MVHLLYLMAAAGLAFVLGHKLPRLHVLAAEPGWWADKLSQFLECAFCRGCLSGGLVWLVSWAVEGSPLLSHGDDPSLRWCLAGIIWVFASGVGALGFDTLGADRKDSV